MLRCPECGRTQAPNQMVHAADCDTGRQQHNRAEAIATDRAHRHGVELRSRIEHLAGPRIPSDDFAGALV